MDTEYKISQMEIIIKDIILMENLMEKVSITGLMEHIIKEILWKDLEKDKELG